MRQILFKGGFPLGEMTGGFAAKSPQIISPRNYN